MRIFLLLFLLTLPWSAQAITLAEGIEKCRAMSKEERSGSQLCQKVIAKIREYKAAGKPIPGYPSKSASPTAPTPEPVNAPAKVETTPVVPTAPVTSEKQLAPKKDKAELEFDKMAKIKEKCQKLAPPNQYKYKVCHQYMSISNDPFFGKEKPASAQYSVSLGYSLLGDISGLDFEVERRTNNFGIGLFFSNQKISDVNSDQISGSAYGISAHYHFTPLYYTKQGKMDISGFGQVGMASYTSSAQGQLPSYIYFNVGIDASVPLLKMGDTTLRGFAKAGVVHIYHSESSFLGLGGQGTLGLKFDF